jgi:xylose isomerase
MRNWRLAVNAAFLGRRRDRFTEYQPDRTLEEKFNLAAGVEGIEGIELKYPFDLKDVKLAKRLLEETGLICPAVNVDIKDATYFRYGALSAQSADARNRSASLLREGMDMAAELGAGLVTTCPLADGHDYPFQADYRSAWAHFIETVKAVVSHRADVKLALEYQPHEPHAKIMLGNVGMALHVCSEVGEPNLGVNLDIGHSFAAGESPATSAALLASKDKLFYIHTNDNTEAAPKHFGPGEAYDTNTRMIQRMIELLNRMDPNVIDELVKKDGTVAETFNYLSRCLVQGP